MEAALDAASDFRDGLQRLVPEGRGRRGPEDGWMAVFFEFWAHVLRHPELRERFAQQHRRVTEPVARAAAAVAREHGRKPPDDPRKLATALYAMQLGLQLERLTQPEVVDEELALRMARLYTDGGGLDGLPG